MVVLSVVTLLDALHKQQDPWPNGSKRPHKTIRPSLPSDTCCLRFPYIFPVVLFPGRRFVCWILSLCLKQWGLINKKLKRWMYGKPCFVCARVWVCELVSICSYADEPTWQPTLSSSVCLLCKSFYARSVRVFLLIVWCSGARRETMELTTALIDVGIQRYLIVYHPEIVDIAKASSRWRA